MEPMRFLVKQIESSNRVKGLLISGQINADESVSLMPSGQQAYILLIEKEANYHQSINAKAELSLELTYSVSMKEGDMIVPLNSRPEFADPFEARIYWLSKQDLLPGRAYILKTAGGKSEATISKED